MRHPVFRFYLKAVLACALSGGVAGSAVPRFSVPPHQKDLIEKALPKKPLVRPRASRRLLIFNLNVGYPGHPSAARSAYAFKLMGRRTGAFEAVSSSDPSVFEPENLKRFDAVLFNNTVGNLFTDPALRRSLIRFVYSGGGLGGIHGTSVAFTRWPGAVEDWPEFGIMLGARGARHRESKELVTIKLDDPSHPLVKVFGGKSFTYRDEFFRFSNPYSRKRLRVLLSINTEKTDLRPRGPWTKPERRDNDYALAWVRSYGRGRVFYCTIGHNSYVFWDPTMLRFYLGLIQFILGDLKAPTTPSAFLSPETRALEKLCWRLAASPSQGGSLLDHAATAEKSGFLYLEAKFRCKVSNDSEKRLDWTLTPEEREKIRLSLDTHHVRLLCLSVSRLPENQSELEKLFAFARRMGIEILTVEPKAGILKELEALSRKYDLKVAFEMKGVAGVRRWANLLKARDRKIGICLTVSDAASVDGACAQAGDRLIAVRFAGSLARRFDPRTKEARLLARTLQTIADRGPLVFLYRRA